MAVDGILLEAQCRQLGNQFCGTARIDQLPQTLGRVWLEEHGVEEFTVSSHGGPMLAATPAAPHREGSFDGPG